MFLLIQWIYDSPTSWTVVSSDYIADGTLRKSKNLTGKILGINWSKRVHKGLVVETGTDEALLESKADELAEKEFDLTTIQTSRQNTRKRSSKDCSDDGNQIHCRVAPAAGPSKTSRKSCRIEQINSVLENVNNVTCSNQAEEVEKTEGVHVDASIDWEDKYHKIKRKLKRTREKYRSLKDAHALCSSDESVELVEGSGIRLLQSEVLAFKTISSSITFFVRNLFRRFYAVEDFIGHSLLGRKSTSMKDHVPLPPVDTKKRDAIIDFALKTYGYEANSKKGSEAHKARKSTRTMIIKSLSDMIREENKKAKMLS